VTKNINALTEIIKEAEAEIDEEARKTAKSKYKSKLRQLKQAKQVVSNIERELEELKLEMTDELS
jgi:hypothetical protein